MSASPKTGNRATRRPRAPAAPGDAQGDTPGDAGGEDGLRHRVAIVEQPGGDKFRILQTALDRGGFWERLDSVRRACRVERQDLRIVIKADLSPVGPLGVAATDPALVEALIDSLCDAGYGRVTLGATTDGLGRNFENRDVFALADLTGYKFATPKGRDYEIADLAEDLGEFRFPPGGVLAGTGLARCWLDAHFRICFAKNKTDEEDGYALCLHGLLGVLPLRDKLYHYRRRLDAGEVAVEILGATPVHFALIDAVVSNHGGAGTRRERGLATDTVIAASDPLLSDMAGALKMGLDPAVSGINKRAMRALGLPESFAIDGSLTPYPGWINVHPLIRESTRRRGRWTTMDRALRPWVQSVDEERFPFKDPLDAHANAWLSSYISDPDGNPGAFWLIVALNYLLAALWQSTEEYRTLFDKDRLQHVEVPLGLDLEAFRREDYDAIPAYLSPLAELARRSPPDRNGLRWRYFDESVLFEFSREIPVPFDDFVARVQVGKAIQFMNDYIGGVVVPVARDEQGRVIRQAERNLYLPQPNYLVLYQGKVIDVSKIELVRYEPDAHRMYWRTIKSENDSARFDDGIVTFARLCDGETRITVFGRQEFVLPPFWQAVNLDLYPELKDVLVTHAYTSFFTRTMANFEARYEGRDVRIGQPWDPRYGEDDDAGHELEPAQRLARLAGRLEGFLKEHGGDLDGLLSGISTSPGPQPSRMDEDGFSHFTSGTGVGDGHGARAPANGGIARNPLLAELLDLVGGEVTGFVSDLGAAMRKDAALHFGAAPDAAPDAARAFRDGAGHRP